jgi:hypothetical protein
VVFQIFIVIMNIVFASGCVAFGLWAVLHKPLCQQLDKILFREPYFQKSELANYQFFPLSLLKSLNYIGLVAAPCLLKKKRFGGFSGEVPISRPVRLACKLCFSFFVLLAIMFFVYFGYGAWVFVAFPAG